MKPTERQRLRLAQLEARFLRWSRFQEPGRLVQAGLFAMALRGSATDRRRADRLACRAVDPRTGRLEWDRLTGSERDELARLIGTPEGMNDGDGDDGARV